MPDRIFRQAELIQFVLVVLLLIAVEIVLALVVLR